MPLELQMSSSDSREVASGKGPRDMTSGRKKLEVALLTGGRDAPYAYGIVTELSAREIQLEVIGGDSVDFPEFHSSRFIRFLNLRGDQSRNAGFGRKLVRVLAYYARLLRYAAAAKPKIFHILWNNKFEIFDRTLLLLYYRLLGKKIVLTAHNVNAGWRDANDSLINRLSLRAQYGLADHIFVHTEKMKRELVAAFSMDSQTISVIPFGINNSLKVTNLSCTEARERLGLADQEKAVLFFGNIAPYKGLDVLVKAFLSMAPANPDLRLIIVGAPRPGCEGYWREIEQSIRLHGLAGRVILRICYIPDEETELYFKAADVAVLPYRIIFQSGVLFLAYSFGLPVIATDVGELGDDIVPGETGFLCRPDLPDALVEAIQKYFQSNLYRDLESRRKDIREFALARHSWELVGQKTQEVYLDLLGERPA